MRNIGSIIKSIQMQKYAVNQQLIETLLAWVNSGEIAILEIQRPFVRDSSKVRDLMDRLYSGRKHRSLLRNK